MKRLRDQKLGDLAEKREKKVKSKLKQLLKQELLRNQMMKKGGTDREGEKGV